MYISLEMLNNVVHMRLLYYDISFYATPATFFVKHIILLYVNDI
jgi:hypothetical protein